MQLKIGNHMMLLHPGDNYAESYMWRRGERIEAASIGRLTLLVAGKRSLIFDVGANCGAYTIALAAAAGSGSRIVAFEPNPVMAKRLRTNLELNHMLDSVELEEVAVGEKDGLACLHLDKSNLGGSALVAAQSNGTIPVAIRPLVRYVPEERWNYRNFVVKIDVEGYEDRVLAPFLASIAWQDMPDAILVETRHAEVWSIDIVALLKQRGYAPHFEGEDHNTLFLRAQNIRWQGENSEILVTEPNNLPEVGS